jgi:hypothetical protein
MTGIVSQNVARTSGLVKAVSGGGTWTLIETLTSDGSDADLSFTSGIDSTYPIYVFKWINIHPETDQANFTFQSNAVGASGYNETMTTTAYQAQKSESDADELSYEGGSDQAQGTAFQAIGWEVGSGNDECASGELWLFDPSSTIFTKQYLSVCNMYRYNNYSQQYRTAGYINTASAIDEIQFKFSTGEIQAGKIKLYGLGDS